MFTGERIKLRRKELGMNAEALASACGVSPATMYRYEKGDIENMGIDKLSPIAKALHTTPAFLMGWSDDPEGEKATTLLGDGLSPLEQAVLSAFRSMPEEKRQALLLLLGIQ